MRDAPDAGPRRRATAFRATKSARGKRRPAAAGATLHVLFTCVGRRVELIRAFRAAGEALGVRLVVHGADANRLAPAMHRVDKAHLVPTIDSGRYVDTLLDLVHGQKISMLVPLLDVELIAIAEASDRFDTIGCRAVISSERVVRACRDKIATHRALVEAGIDTPDTWPWLECLRWSEHRFPYYMKPRTGSAAKGNFIVRSREELETLGRRVDEPIVQEFVQGVEHTLDVYAGLDGVPRCVVPRRRIEVRAGEVSKGVIVKHPGVMRVGARVVEALGECRGVVTVQCMVTPDERIRVIEINPRFGGGAPLAIHAGADFPRWLLMEHLGLKPRIRPSGFRDDVAMLRYDDSVFVPDATRKLGLTRHR